MPTISFLYIKNPKLMFPTIEKIILALFNNSTKKKFIHGMFFEKTMGLQ